MVFEEGCKFRTDEPGNLGVWETFAKAGESGQGEDDIAEGAGLDYKDVFELSALRSHRRHILRERGILGN